MTLLWFAIFVLILAPVSAITWFVSYRAGAGRRKKYLALFSNARSKPHAVGFGMDEPSPRGASWERLLGPARTRALQTRIYRAGLQWDVRGFLLLSIALAIGGAMAAARLQELVGPAAYPALAGVCGLLPSLHLRRRTKKRLDEFEKQLPEALEFLARAVKAGNALSMSLELLAAEVAEPLRSEFRKVANQVNLGGSTQAALNALADRVPLLDVRLFVAAVVLQSGTGGNLGEVLTRIAYLMRERFRVRGQIRAITAQGRLTARVLTAMPVGIAVMINFISPGYLADMLKDSAGKPLVSAAIFAQVMAYFWINRIVNFKL